MFGISAGLSVRHCIYLPKHSGLYKIIRSILFLLPPEAAHNMTMSLLSGFVRLPFMSSVVRSIYGTSSLSASKTVFGLRFKNPVGLAAGFDKDGKYIRALACLGFGFIEVGTVTPRPQDGNPQPRLFRLKHSKALINRMGFNN